MRQPSDRVVVVFVVISVHQLRLAKTKTKECADGPKRGRKSEQKTKAFLLLREREKEK